MCVNYPKCNTKRVFISCKPLEPSNQIKLAITKKMFIQISYRPTQQHNTHTQFKSLGSSGRINFLWLRHEVMALIQ